MVLNKEVEELMDLVVKPKPKQPRPRSKLAEQLSDITENLLTATNAVLACCEKLEQFSVIKKPATTTLTVGVHLAPLLPTIKGQCDQLLETGLPKDNITKNLHNELGESNHNQQLLNSFIRDTNQSISNLHSMVRLATSLFPPESNTYSFEEGRFPEVSSSSLNSVYNSDKT